MTPLSPHDPLDDLMAAALHGELSPQERTQFQSRLQTDPAARAAYQEAQAMHDLLEKTHRDAQTDAAFEERMISGVRRKIHHETRREETAWESLLFLWQWMKQIFSLRRRLDVQAAFAFLIILLVVAGVTLRPITASLDKAERRAIRDNLAATAVPTGTVVAMPQTIYRTDQTLQARATPLLAEKHGPDADNGTTEKAPTSSSGAEVAAVDSAPAVAAAEPAPPPTPLDAPTTMAAPAVDSQNDVSTKKQVNTMFDNLFGGEKRAGARKAVEEVVPVHPATPSSPELSQKLIRNAQLDLEVKSFQPALDEIGALTKAAAGYVDSSSSEKGGNGKLQGTVVVKVLPQNLDAFLLKLRDAGSVQNQSVSTENVTKDYYDTQARLDNARRMETQLQDLLKHENSKVADLLQVERELGRVRGEIEQMQGQLKLYDFQVQYATVTINLKEKDLNQAAAYLLKEQDDFSLFAGNVEATFQQARATADRFKAQVLQANLNHNSGSDVSAELVVTVAPDQIEPFLAEIQSLGRVANFTRQTQRVAQDGGDSDQPADETRTEKDKVQVHVAIRSDDESRQQASLTVVTPAVDEALEKARAAALATGGVEILGSSLNKTPQGPSTAQLSVRVPGPAYPGLLDAFRALGHASTFSLQRADSSGPGASGNDAPVIVALSLTDDDTPVQQTEISLLVAEVEERALAIKKQAGAAGVEVKDSTFERQTDGTETAQMNLRLPLSKYPGFIAGIEKLGKVEALTIERQDRPATEADATAEISLKIHNQADVVPENTGLWATIRQTFSAGAAALFGSVKTIGVVLAFLAPWLLTLGLLAWVGRRIYVSRKS